ncbi:MAG: hypothetical protein V4548_07930 [Bacteroidota bacterium]
MKNLLLLFILIPFSALAKFYPGNIILNDGTSKKGFIEIPAYNDAKIKFKADKKEKAESFEIGLVKSFEIVNDENITLKYVTIFLANQKPFKPSEFTVDKKKSWVMIVKEGKINLYSVYFNSATDEGYSFYIKKEKDDHALFISQSFGGGNICMNCFTTLKSTIKTIFEKDCPKLSDLLDKNDLKKNGLSRIVELYEENCGTK